MLWVKKSTSFSTVCCGHEGAGGRLPVSMNSVVMTLRHMFSLLMMVTMILDHKNDIWTLPAPIITFMDSVNMRHTLRWHPLQAPCNTTILYSVQYQGEFELLLRNGSWVDAADCQQIAHTHCDLTPDLGSDSDYTLQVRGQCGSENSAWTKLSSFNRNKTNLTAPEMTVTSVGGALHVSFSRLPLTSTVDVTVWREDNESQVVVHSFPAEQKVLHVAALQDGWVYCVKARTVLVTGQRSPTTAARCVSITGPDSAAWKTPTALSLTLIITAGLLFAVFWSVVHCRPHACKKYFQKEPLPQSLKGNWDQILMSPQQQQDEELCERLSEVLSVEPDMNEPNTKSALMTHEENRER
ncbi:interleukin-20 receptor subunit beta [Pholidichthys leucotaenia]